LKNFILFNLENEYKSLGDFLGVRGMGVGRKETRVEARYEHHSGYLRTLPGRRGGMGLSRELRSGGTPW
jgi:hypothetical protein